MKKLMHYIHSTFNYLVNIDAQKFADNARISLLNKSEYNVYANPVTIPGYEDQYEHLQKLTQKALNEWSKVLDGRIKFNVQTTIMGADIKLYWRKAKRIYAAKQYMEAITWDSAGNPIIVIPAVNIGIMDLDNTPYSDDDIYHLILHEFGHILTLGHSPDPHDVMCGCGDWNPHLTEKDKFVLKLIYSFPTLSTYQECLPEIKKRVAEFIKKEKEKEENKNTETQPEKLKINNNPQNLLDNLDNIKELVQYNMALKGVSLNEEVSKHFTKPKYLAMNPEEIS